MQKRIHQACFAIGFACFLGCIQWAAASAAPTDPEQSKWAGDPSKGSDVNRVYNLKPVAFVNVPCFNNLRITIYKDSNPDVKRYLFFPIALNDSTFLASEIKKHSGDGKPDTKVTVPARFVINHPEIIEKVADAAKAQIPDITKDNLMTQPVDLMIVEVSVGGKQQEVARVRRPLQTLESDVKGSITATLADLQRFAEAPSVTCRLYGSGFGTTTYALTAKLVEFVNSVDFQEIFGDEHIKDQVLWSDSKGQGGFVISLPGVAGGAGGSVQNGDSRREATRWVSRNWLIERFRTHLKNVDVEIWNEFDVAPNVGLDIAVKIFENWIDGLAANAEIVLTGDKEAKIQVADNMYREFDASPSNFKELQTTSKEEIENERTEPRKKKDTAQSQKFKALLEASGGVSVEGGRFATKIQVVNIDSTAWKAEAQTKLRYIMARAMSFHDITTCSTAWPLPRKQEVVAVIPIGAPLTLRPALVTTPWQVPFFPDYPLRAALVDQVLPNRSGMHINAGNDVFYKLSAGGDDDPYSQALVSIEATALYDAATNSIQFAGEIWVVEWDGESGRWPHADWTGGHASIKAAPIPLPPATNGQKIIDVALLKHNFRSTFLVTNTDKVDPNKSKGRYKDGGFTNVCHDPASIVSSMTGVIDRGWHDIGLSPEHDCQVSLQLSCPVQVRYQTEP